MAKKEQLRGFDNLINTTTDAFAASSAEGEGASGPVYKMVNNRQSVYRVPLSMIRPDRFQARFTLPYAIRNAFYKQDISWREAASQWLQMAKKDRLVRREVDELVFLADSLHDEGQIKPVTGQVISKGGQDYFHMLTGERRFWATAIRAVLDKASEEPYVLAIIDNQPTLEKQIAENMAYKPLTAVAKARAAARIVLEANDVKPGTEEDEYAYFQRVSEMRLSEETREKLQETLQLERTYFGRLMKFFELSEEQLSVCDLAEMPERVLREIMHYERKYWEAGVRYYAEDDNRTYLDVAQYMKSVSGQETRRAPRPVTDPATKTARTMRRALMAVENIPQDDKIGTLADAMLSEMDREKAHDLLGTVNALRDALEIRVRNLG